jgi:GAF domain-containing protein
MEVDRSRHSLDSLARAARQLQAVGTADDLLQHIVDIAVDTIEGCQYAGISTDRNGRTNSPVVSDPAALAIDALQYSINTGPCLAAMRGPDVFVDAPDLERDPRFTPFGEEAARSNCRSALAHRLYVDSVTLGSLNLYGSTPNAYTDDDRERSVVLAGLASLALNVMRLEADGEGLREAVQSRDVIGQAKGILMEREVLSADEAFEVLRQRSQHENIKLRDVAESLVDQHGSATRLPRPE